ncbi:MAG: hypothetical protein K0S04_348 [Herbinix sp.]|nr:hypothetical protein [Herbinix sp.]
MNEKIIYMDMPESITAISIKNDDSTYTIVINTKARLCGAYEEKISELLREGQ